MNKNLLLACACFFLLGRENVSAQAADAEVSTFTSPADTSFCPAQLPVSINIYNNDLVDITEVVLDWSINSVAQPSVTWSGLITAGDITPVELTPLYDFVSGTTYDIQVTIQSVNTLPDPNTSNDTYGLTFDAYLTPEPQFYWDGCGLSCINCEFGTGDYDSLVWLRNGVPDPAAPNYYQYTPSQSGTYSIIGFVTGSGCEATTDSVIFASPPTHGITALGVTAFCEGDSVGLVFAASVPVFFQWNTTSTEDTIYATADGWYTVTGTTTNSCPVADSIFVTVHPLPVVTISNMNDTLVSDYSGLNQWYFNGTQIGGAHDSTYVPAQSGMYYCTATDVYGCTGTSNTINWIMPGISIPVKTADILLYPNPAKDVLNIRFIAASEKLEMKIFDAAGRLVIREEIAGDRSINISSLDEGVYHCLFTGAGKSFSQKLVKTF
jgi:hypothetical protein